jgi:flagellar motor switch/type III secretory pathway protein FliN
VSANFPTRAFPWDSLDSLTRAETAVLRSIHRWSAAYVHVAEIEKALGTLLGTTVRVGMRRAERMARARAFGEGYGVLLRGDEAPTVEALLQVESALANAVVARVIDRTSPLFHKAGQESSGIAGALAAVVGTAARRTRSIGALRTVSAGSATELQATLPGPDEDWAAIALTVSVGDDAYVARLLLSTRRARAAPDPTWTRRELAALGAMPLSLPLVAAVFCSTASDVASLARGDAIVPLEWPLARTSNGSGWTGMLLLAAPAASTGVVTELSDDGRLMLRGDPQGLWAGEAEMVESDESSALVTAVGDIPIVVRVEIGEAYMAAREWATLQRGDVIALGRRIGERVILRVGGVAVATGELVEIEGDVGVRIVERLNVGRTSV